MVDMMMDLWNSDARFFIIMTGTFILFMLVVVRDTKR